MNLVALKLMCYLVHIKSLDNLWKVTLWLTSVLGVLTIAVELNCEKETYQT